MKTFEELDLILPVRRALADECYEIPTPIQAMTIPPALNGRDVLGCAQTGTGKTAAFALPILNRLGQRNCRAESNRPHGLVLAPTRELAIQIAESFATYGKHLQLRQALVYGGVSQAKQVLMLNRGAHILVATPGRLLDLMNQGHIELHQLEMFALDEVDRMLDMGFLPDLKRIISQLPSQRQSLFFSATLPPRIMELAKRLLRNPFSVNVSPKSPSVENIEQRVLFVERSGKQALLSKVLRSDEVDSAIVFTRTKRGANVLAEKLVRGGIKATAIHGNKSQNARQQALADFQCKRVQVLVATDVAARGIDIDGITHVVNFDLPHEPESYVHRIGRTGRAGGVGMALSFCSPSERSELGAIEKFIGKRLDVLIEQQRSLPQPANSQGSAVVETEKSRLGGSENALATCSHKRKQKTKSHGCKNARRRAVQIH
ncbi:MAG: DEAD/DEAH box helicase [Planctomycetales bacterium]|nr:DEAD/DEAH box helicase [Planctomycetales bacterium]